MAFRARRSPSLRSRFGRYANGDFPSAAADGYVLEKEILLSLGTEPVEYQRILAHVRVDFEGDLAPLARKIVEARQWDMNLVADSLHIQQNQVWLLGQKLTFQIPNHAGSTTG